MACRRQDGRAAPRSLSAGWLEQPRARPAPVPKKETTPDIAQQAMFALSSCSASSVTEKIQDSPFRLAQAQAVGSGSVPGGPQARPERGPFGGRSRRRRAITLPLRLSLSQHRSDIEHESARPCGPYRPYGPEQKNEESGTSPFGRCPRCRPVSRRQRPMPSTSGVSPEATEATLAACRRVLGSRWL